MLENHYLDHILKSTAGFFEDDRDVLECLDLETPISKVLASLALPFATHSLSVDVIGLPGQFHRCVVSTDIAADIYGSGVNHGLGEERRLETLFRVYCCFGSHIGKACKTVERDSDVRWLLMSERDLWIIEVIYICAAISDCLLYATVTILW